MSIEAHSTRQKTSSESPIAKVLSPRVFDGTPGAWADAHELARAKTEPVFVPVTPFADERGWSLMNLFAGAMGFSIESQQTDLEVVTVIESFTSDKYGVVYRNRPPEPVGGLRVAFVTVGQCELEFLQNFDPRHGADVRHGGPGTTKQDQGAIARYVAKRGAGLHHLALKTPDIDRTLATLDEAGFRVIDRTGRPGSRRARIGFVHPSALGGVLVHFVEREPV